MSEAADDTAPTPREQAKSATETAIRELRDVDADTKVEALTAEEDIVTDWGDEIATAVEGGYTRGHVDAMAGEVASEAQFYNKTEVRGVVNDRIDAAEESSDPVTDLLGEGSGSGPVGSRETPPVDEWVADNLKRVVKIETTDRRQGAVWRWHFPGGVVETEKTKDGITHFSWSHFRDEIYVAVGKDLQAPDGGLKESENWRRFVQELIHRRGETQKNFGPRSDAVERLQHYIRHTTAYPDMQDAVERDGVYVDDDPDAGDCTELRIRNNEIKRITDDAEISLRALQNELDARGHTHPDVNGVSDSEYVSGLGRTVRYWVLDPGIATPGTYDPDPKTPAESAREEREAAGDGDTDTNAGDDGAQDDASDAGEIDSIGVDPDDQDDQDDQDDEDDAHDPDEDAQGDGGDGEE